VSRKWISAVIACALVGVAVADPNDLSGGVLVTHFDPEWFSYTYDPPAGGWCEMYSAYPIHGLEEVNAQIMSEGAWIWFVLAAWESEDKVWCGTEFGFGAYDPNPWVFYEYAPCFPVNGLEIPTPNWPGPNEGTAFVTAGDPWMGNWVPVYYFAGYNYGYAYGATIIQIDVDPPTAFCGFANCLNPPDVYAVDPWWRGGMGINMPGYVPGTVPPAGACCLPEPPGACEFLYGVECEMAGGTWLGAGIPCEPVNPCPQPGACCTGGICQVMLEPDCLLAGGTFQGAGTTCEPNPCPAVCCFEGPGPLHPCQILLEADCLAIPGFWHPEWTTCDPNPCEIYTPAGSTTWGRIKSMYR